MRKNNKDLSWMIGKHPIVCACKHLEFNLSLYFINQSRLKVSKHIRFISNLFHIQKNRL